MKRILLALGSALALVLVFRPTPAHAAITNIGSCSANSGTPVTCTYSTAPSSGDAIVVCAYRNGSTTAPLIPTSGWTRITTSGATGANTNSITIGVRISNGTETSITSAATTGFANASAIAASIYRGAMVAPIGTIAETGAGTGTTASFPALTTFASTSWVIGCMGHKVAANLNAPAGMTLRSRTTTAGSVTNIVIADTNAGTSSWSATNITVTSGAYRSETVELLAPTGEDTLKLYADNYLHMVGQANGTVSTTSLAAGNDGLEDMANCYVNNAVATPTGFTIVNHFQAALGTIHVRSPATDYATSTSTKALNIAAANTECRWEALQGARHHGAVAIGGWVSFPPDIAGSGNIFDLWRVTTVDGNYCVMQLNNGNYNANATGYGITAEVDANNDGTPEKIGLLTLTGSTTYWVAFYCNYQTGEVKLAAFDTSGTQVGSTVTGSIFQGDNTANETGMWFDDIRIGNAEVGTPPQPNTKFEDIIVDYSNATFPLGPNVTGGGGGAVVHNRMLMGVGQ
jgi:hypothetical protein